MTDMASFDGLMAIKSCDTYLLKLSNDGMLMESFNCGGNWSKAEFTDRVCGWLKDVLSPAISDAQSHTGQPEGLTQ